MWMQSLESRRLFSAALELAEPVASTAAPPPIAQVDDAGGLAQRASRLRLLASRAAIPDDSAGSEGERLRTHTNIDARAFSDRRAISVADRPAEDQPQSRHGAMHERSSHATE